MKNTTKPGAASEMTAGRPNPTEHREIPIDDDAMPVRRLYCGRYGACVSFASVMNWGSFTCADCGVVQPCDARQMERDEPRHEVLGKFLVGIGAHRTNRTRKEISR